MATWILRLDEGRGPLRVAIKDLLDWQGSPTTAGSLAVARRALPAPQDAACLGPLRAGVVDGRYRVSGKANLDELAAGVTGINPWFGTPVNPRQNLLVPGGSSSGSAAAVGAGEADIAIGTDTAGSVRIPAACCGVVGLKTTYGRVPLAGVWPLAPSLDTVGPLARDVAGVVAGMALLEPGFVPAPPPPTVGRLRLSAPGWIDDAVDLALRRAEISSRDVTVPGWAAAGEATMTVIGAEAATANREVLTRGGVAHTVASALAAAVTAPLVVDGARAELRAWRTRLSSLIERHGPLVTPTLVVPVPTVADGDPHGRLLLATAPVNGAGLPALTLPVAAGGRIAALQLIGAAGSEDALVALGARIEAAGAG